MGSESMRKPILNRKDGKIGKSSRHPVLFPIFPPFLFKIPIFLFNNLRTLLG